MTTLNHGTHSIQHTYIHTTVPASRQCRAELSYGIVPRGQTQRVASRISLDPLHVPQPPR